jgi:RsiW-degrading membrane proteinase PrsW (M82 family)
MVNTAFVYALLSGLLPALLWLWFWLREDHLNPEPKRLIFFIFIGGMLIVPLVIPIQQWILNIYNDGGSPVSLTFLLWSLSEEMSKLFIAYLLAIHSRHFDEPVDAVIYMITVALGFAALENTFFIFHPLDSGDAIKTIVTGNLRFIGATLLHVVSSASIGLFIAFAFYKSKIAKIMYSLLGLLVATILHTAFNLFIMETTGSDTLIVFGCVWIAVVVLILLFEKIKTIQNPVHA